VFGDARVRRGVLSQLLPVSEMSWDRPRNGVAAAAARRRSGARSNVVTTDYGWIDEAEEADSDKENRDVEDRDGGRQPSPSCGGGGRQVLDAGWKSSDSMDVDDDDDDDQCVDVRRCDGRFQTSSRHDGRLTHPRCRLDAPSLMLPGHVGRRPLGTIVEATETSTNNASDDHVDEPEEEFDVVVEPEPEILPTSNTCEPTNE